MQPAQLVSVTHILLSHMIYFFPLLAAYTMQCMVCLYHHFGVSGGTRRPFMVEVSIPLDNQELTYNG